MMWVYAFSGAARRDPPDLLDDPSFAAEAEPVCSDARTVVDRLPELEEDSEPALVIEVVSEGNESLTAMVAELRALAPRRGRDGELVARWLDDWETHVEDRRRWIERVRVEGPVGFTETGHDGQAISVTIDNFATVNEMPSCATR